MLLAFMNVWDIMHGSKEPPSNADPKVLKDYQRHVKKAMPIINLNLADNQLAQLQMTHRGVEDSLQHSQDEEFVQHPLYSL